jgi:hypothetical protein
MMQRAEAQSRAGKTEDVDESNAAPEKAESVKQETPAKSVKSEAAISNKAPADEVDAPEINE